MAIGFVGLHEAGTKQLRDVHNTRPCHIDNQTVSAVSVAFTLSVSMDLQTKLKNAKGEEMRQVEAYMLFLDVIQKRVASNRCK